MRILICLLFVASVPLMSSAQNKKSCCQSPTQEFAMLGSSAEFRSAHLSPEPISFTPGLGKDISFPTPDGGTGSAYSIMADSKSKDYLIVFHEWWGLNNHIRKECEKLSLMLDGVNIMAVDLYEGRTTTQAEEASKLMQAVDDKRARAIVKGALNHIGADARVQTLGWCFGGGWSLQCALMAPSNSVGCVIYYGMPEQDTEKLKSLNAPVLGIFASQDTWVNQEIVDSFEQNMRDLSKTVTIKWYDAEHAFANPSNPQFNEVATEDASKMTITFLKNNYLK